MSKKLKLEDLKVQSFITDGTKLGGYRAAVVGIGGKVRGTEQTECYHCDSAGQGCSAPCN